MNHYGGEKQSTLEKIEVTGNRVIYMKSTNSKWHLTAH